MFDDKKLIVPQEKTYFTIALVISSLAWFLLLLSCWGLLLVPIAAGVTWLTHGLLIARLRSESVLVSAEQLPTLYRTYLQVCANLGVTVIPELYLLQNGGVINAFATRHAGRNFVVLYSSFLDVFPADAPEIRFILGHELGHLQRHHHFRKACIYPAHLFPMITEAYSRACESTCDRFGAVGAGDVSGAPGALVLLSGGRWAAKEARPELFARQYRQHRGFFISWHELTSTYPSLSRRVEQVTAFSRGAAFTAAPRNLLAYLFAYFVNVRTLFLLYLLIFGLSILMAIGHKKTAQSQCDLNHAVQDQVTPTAPAAPTPGP